jgi:hypothetical protein
MKLISTVYPGAASLASTVASGEAPRVPGEVRGYGMASVEATHEARAATGKPTGETRATARKMSPATKVPATATEVATATAEVPAAAATGVSATSTTTAAATSTVAPARAGRKRNAGNYHSRGQDPEGPCQKSRLSIHHHGLHSVAAP